MARRKIPGTRTLEISAALLRKNDLLLQKLETWFHRIQDKYGSVMRCANGCAQCCRGLFDISVPDAMRVAEGLALLEETVRDEVVGRAAAIQRRIIQEQPDLRPPYFLDALPDDGIDGLIMAVGEVRCPFLDAKDSCLIYGHRPIACRLEGMPMVDLKDGLFGDWCELNFRQGPTPELLEDLRFDYDEIQVVEQKSAVFIASIVFAISYDQWKPVVRKRRAASHPCPPHR